MRTPRHPFSTSRRLTAVAAAMLLVITGCGGDADTDENPPAAAEAGSAASDGGGVPEADDAEAAEATDAEEEAGAEPTEGPEPTVTPAPTVDQLHEAALMLPPGCADLIWGDGAWGGLDYTTTPAQFTDGVLTPGAPTSKVTLGDEVHILSTPIEELAAIHIDCYNGGSGTPHAIGVYDADLQLVGYADPMDIENYPGPWHDSRMHITSISTEGDTLTYEEEEIAVFGDGPDGASKSSGSATMTWQFDGEKMVHQDAVLHAGGKDIRPPAIEDVQHVVDLLAAGDPSAGDFFIDGEAPDLAEGRTDQRFIEDESFRLGRADLFPVGAHVGSCEIIGGGEFLDAYPSGKIMAGPYYLRSGGMITYTQFVAGGPTPMYDTFPGDTVCLIQHADNPYEFNSEGVHLVLARTEDGSVVIRDVGIGVSLSEM